MLTSFDGIGLMLYRAVSGYTLEAVIIVPYFEPSSPNDNIAFSLQ